MADIPSTQMWAVSFFFVNLVLAVAIGILFMSNSTPGNKKHIIMIMNKLVMSDMALNVNAVNPGIETN